MKVVAVFAMHEGAPVLDVEEADSLGKLMALSGCTCEEVHAYCFLSPDGRKSVSIGHDDECPLADLGGSHETTLRNPDDGRS